MYIIYIYIYMYIYNIYVYIVYIYIYIYIFEHSASTLVSRAFHLHCLAFLLKRSPLPKAKPSRRTIRLSG